MMLQLAPEYLCMCNEDSESRDPIKELIKIMLSKRPKQGGDKGSGNVGGFECVFSDFHTDSDEEGGDDFVSDGKIETLPESFDRILTEISTHAGSSTPKDFETSTWLPFGKPAANRLLTLKNEPFKIGNGWNVIRWGLLVAQALVAPAHAINLAVREFDAIISDARSSRLDFKDLMDTRYFIHDGDHEGSRCEHRGQCDCWFSGSDTAGIPPAPGTEGSKALCGLDAVGFAHNLVAQLLMILVDYVTCAIRQQFTQTNKNHRIVTLSQALQNVIYNTLKLAQPELDDGTCTRQSGDHAANVVWEPHDGREGGRYLYLRNDSWLQECAQQARLLIAEIRLSSDLLNNEELTIVQLELLMATLGRRLLTLSVCRYGQGNLFRPARVLDFSGLVRDFLQNSEVSVDDYFQPNPNYEINLPRYPTRVINTETLEFEEAQTLYKRNYAILSHVWITRGREVTYDRFNATMAEEKRARAIVKVRKELEKTGGELKRYSDTLEKEWQKIRDSPLEPMLGDTQEKKWPCDLCTRMCTINNLQAEIKRLKKQARDLSKDMGATVEIAGKSKLVGAIQIAENLGFKYLWVDSCCIDKSNNTELTEAISSMGDWYSNAQVCLVYLDDVGDTYETLPVPGVDSKIPIRWGTRGWTLQEIVMCRRALFFRSDWKKIADSASTKDLFQISCVSNTPERIICSGGKANVAASVIMKLAARRQTTRPEDRAYCLMGMLGIRLTPDYGEGQDKAIVRLIELIVRTTGDVSVFNWRGENRGSTEPGRSMFPKDFVGFLNVGREDEGEESNEKEYEEEEPLKISSSLNLGNMGIHSRFDISKVVVCLEGDHPRALEALGKLPIETDLECSVACSLTLDGKDLGKIKVFCSLSNLKHKLQANSLGDGPKEASVKWVMVRFAGVKKANWFLCELRDDSALSGDNVYEGFFQTAGDEMEVYLDVRMARYMRYLETSGFFAKRMNTAKFKQSIIPSDNMWKANLWIG